MSDGEDDFKDADDDDEKEQRTPDAMEENAVELAAGFSGEGRVIAGTAADLRGPGVGAGSVAEDREGEALFGFLCGLGEGTLIEEERDGVKAGALGGADLGDGCAELAGELEGVDGAAAGVHEVAHVEEDQRGQAEG